MAGTPVMRMNMNTTPEAPVETVRGKKMMLKSDPAAPATSTIFAACMRICVRMLRTWHATRYPGRHSQSQLRDLVP